MRLQWPWPPNVCPRNVRRAHRLAWSKAKGGGAEPWNFGGTRNAGDFLCVRECGGERFVDEYRFTASSSLPELVEVDSSVQALQQNSINEGTEIANLADELDAPFVFEFRAKCFDSIPAIGNVRTVALEGCDHASPGEMILVGIVVQELGEFHHMRSIGTNNSQPQVSCECAGREKNRRQKARDKASDPIGYLSGLRHLIRFLYEFHAATFKLLNPRINVDHRRTAATNSRQGSAPTSPHPRP